MSEEEELSAARKRKQRWAFWIATAFFLLCLIVAIFYWVIWGQFKEETDDAYVNGNMILITPQETGIITAILADNTQLVEEGQPLIELDRHDYEILLDRAKADLGESVRQVTQMFIKVQELEAKRDVNKSELLRASWDYNHRQALVSDGSVSKEEFQHSETAFFGAFFALREVDKELQGARAQVNKTTVATHPQVEQAKAHLKKAFLDLHRCTVRAPARGIITQRRAQVGQWVGASDSLMALVPIDQIWVDANYREVSLKHLRIGQPVKLVSDMYGHEVKFHGRIVGLNPGTGSIFSILPPQNASGNWIKIIQRIPVKISLEPKELQKYPLVLGLSMTVKTDTHERDGLRLPCAQATAPIYSTQIYKEELNGADEMIQKIISENTCVHEAD